MTRVLTFTQMAKSMKFSVVGLPHYTIWHLYEPSVDDIRHMEEMEAERLQRETAEKEAKAREDRANNEFANEDQQWKKDKEEIERYKESAEQKEKEVESSEQKGKKAEFMYGEDGKARKENPLAKGGSDEGGEGDAKAG